VNCSFHPPSATDTLFSDGSWAIELPVPTPLAMGCLVEIFGLATVFQPNRCHGYGCDSAVYQISFACDSVVTASVTPAWGPITVQTALCISRCLLNC
jgi:hypothetical protein